jgi:hypothetical protein
MVNEAQLAFTRSWTGEHNEDYFAELAKLDPDRPTNGGEPTPPAAHNTPPSGTATLQHPPLAAEPRILDRFAAEVLRIGVVGEKHIIQLIFLIIVTRLFERVVNLALKGPSAGGKSFLLERVLSYFPESAYYVLSGMSEHALVYDDEPLTHRMLVIYEAAGMAGDLQTYFIRSLLSEGRIRYVTVVKGKSGIEKKLIDRAGPTGLLTTTTKVGLHPENETRLISATVTDTPEQTKLIMLAQAGMTQPADVEPWHNLQRWLALNAAPVVIPYASDLAQQIPPVAVRLRRDFPAVLALIRAHALLHQLARQRDGSGAIVADFDDYAVVREIVAELIGEAAERTIPETVRETVAKVGELTNGGGEASLPEIAAALGIDKSAASRRVRVALNRSYLQNLEDKRGRPSRIVLGDPLPDDVEILPTVEVLQCCSAPPGGEADFDPEYARDDDGEVAS